MHRPRRIRLSIAFLVAVLLLCGAGSAAELWYEPTSNILCEDRVDLGWNEPPAGVDAVVVSLGDGTSVTLPPSATSLRHVYQQAGAFEILLTLMRQGHPVNVMRATVQVGQRVRPTGSVIFVHHSTGRNMLRDSGVRSLLEWHSTSTGTDIRLWDHDYHSGNSYTGIIQPDSTVHSDWSYGVEANNIQPAGYRDIFDGSAFRDSLFDRHEVIVFKNDHRTGDIDSDAKLSQYFEDYLSIRDILDQHPEKLFVMVSGPPRRPEAITPGEADRAREFYDWVQSPAFMNGHPNILFFDLFDALANPNDASDPERNMQRSEYRLPPAGSTDSHPNTLANQTVGPTFASFLVRLYSSQTSTAAPPPPSPVPLAVLAGNAPNPFNPMTEIRWDLNQPTRVRLQVFDLSGRLIRTILQPTWLEAGSHTASWNGLGAGGLDSPSGVYLLRLDAGDEHHSRRMTLVR